MEDKKTVDSLSAQVSVLKKENALLRAIVENKDSALRLIQEQFDVTNSEYESLIRDIKKIREQYTITLNSFLELKSNYQKDMEKQLGKLMNR